MVQQMSTALPTSTGLLVTHNFEVTKGRLAWDGDMLGETKSTKMKKTKKTKKGTIVMERRKVHLLRHITLA